MQGNTQVSFGERRKNETQAEGASQQSLNHSTDTMFSSQTLELIGRATKHILHDTKTEETLDLSQFRSTNNAQPLLPISTLFDRIEKKHDTTKNNSETSHGMGY
ncbi:MAG: hypothetical protein ACI9CD_000959 [Candidatus Deianiraeaceae bacterium]|jgi:hypothetical protein